MTKSNPRLCIVGNLLGKNHGHVTTQGQIIAERFSSDSFEVIAVSSRVNPVVRLLDVVWTILHNYRNIEICIIEIYSGRAFVLADAATFLTKLLRIPAILVLHGGSLPDFTERHLRWVKRVLGRASALVAPSTFLADKLSTVGIELKIIPNVIDLDSYAHRLRSTIAPNLLWMRSFHPIYNPHLALEAFAAIKRRVPKATLVMAGVDKGLEPEIKEMAKEMGLDAAVRFPGFLGKEEKIKEFSAADIFINTNRVDNMPVAVIEACAMGVPVVATSVGGIPDLITNEHDGLLVQDDDARAMAEGVMALLESPELAERISRNGRLLAGRSSWEAVRGDWEDLFTEIMRVKLTTANAGASRQVSNP
ncbi:MAG: glycosyltransferase family 4 protein [Acidobacteriota bacterium]